MGQGLENISPELVKKYQEEIERRSSTATAKRKMSSLRRFFDWAKNEGYVEKHPLREEKPIAPVGAKPPPPAQDNQPQEEPEKKPITKFITSANAIRAGVLAALVVLVFLLIGRVQIPIPWRRTPASEEGQPTQPDAPGVVDTETQEPTLLSPWTIHAKMNLQEVGGGTVTGTQTIAFKLYKTPEGNNPLHNFGEKQISVGEDGNTLIQLDGVPTELFFENEELYLAAEIGGSELNQRLPVSTANVASNLQGYYPEEETGPNAIPVLSDDGSLLLSSEAPSVEATNGNLLVQGNTLTLSTPTASDGDITINPDGSGIAHFVFEGTGQNYLNAQAPNLTSGSLYYGIVANGATGYDLLKLESGSTPKKRFSIDAVGNTYIGGNLNTDGDIQTNTTTRLTNDGKLQNITGFEQDSGNFSITQDAGDTATIRKEESALSDLATLTLKEEGVPNSIYSTLVLKRINGAKEAMALHVDDGNATFDGQLRLGRFSSDPSTSIGSGSLYYNTSSNNIYYWDGSTWVEIGSTSSIPFSNITSGTNTTASMVVGSGASLDYTGSGTINASSLESLTASQFLRSDTSDEFTSGTLTINSGTTFNVDGDITIADTDISFDGASTTFTTTGDLTLSSGGGDVIVSDNDTINIGGSGSQVAYNVIGDTTTGASSNVDSDDDLYIEGNLEVDGFYYGDGSNLTNVDAETFDTFDSTQFLRSDTSDAFTSGTLTINTGTTFDVDGDLTIADSDISFDGASTTFTTTGALTIDTGSTNTINIATDDDILPSGTSGTNDIGSSSIPFDNIYAVSFDQNGNTVCDSSGNCPDAGPWDETSSVVHLDTTSNLVSIGDTTTEHKLEVEGAVTGKALVSLWEKGDQDILVASNSGTPANVFRLTNDGQVVLPTTGSSGGLAIGGDTTLYRSASDVLTTDDTLNAATALQTGGTFEALRNFSIPQRFFVTSANDPNVPVLYVDSNGQITMNAQGAQAVRFNYDKGTGGVIFGTGGGAEAASFDSTGNLSIAGTDISTSQTTLNIDTADTGTINFGDGTNTLAAIKDQDSYPFWNLAGKSTTGDPVSCAEGDIYYNAADDTISICHSASTWEQLNGGGGSSVWSDLLDPTADLTLNHAEYETLFNWDTATDANLDSFTFNLTNDLGTDTSTQRGVVIENADDGGSSGTQDNLLVLDNLDTNEAVTTALEILSSGGGTVTTAIDVSDSDIATALSAGPNDVSGTNWSITGGSGNINSSGVLDINGGGTSDIAGTLRLSGNTLQASGDLQINALAASGQVEFADGDTLNVGGLTDVTYNAFANASDSPEEAAIADDNDLYIGGDLEVDGSLYGGGSGTIGGFTQGSVIFADSAGTLNEDNANFYFDDTNDKLGIGGTPVGKLDVSGAVTGKALTILDETGDQAILTASASGTTVMTLGRAGNLTLSNTGSDSQDIDFDLASDGDFTISDNGTPFAEFTDGGVFTLDSLNLDGTTIGTTSDTDLLSLATDALTVNGDVRIADTFNLEVGGLTGVAYNAFGDAADAADEAAIAADNDLYIGGDLEVDGTIYDSSGNIVAGYWTLSGSDLYTTSTDYKVGIGTNSPISRLHVATNTSTLLGKSALIIDQLEGEDIFTASASGSTKLTLTNSGTLQLFNASSTLSNTSGDITIDAASDTISFAGDDLTNLGYVLASDQVHVGNFASNPTNIGEGSIYYNTTDDKLYYYKASGWTEIGSGSGSGVWTHIDHAVYPNDYWADDVLVGGNSTASAAFRIAANGNLDSSNNTIDWSLNNASDALNIDSNTLSIDASTNRVGIGTASPGQALEVSGNIRANGATGTWVGFQSGNALTWDSSNGPFVNSTANYVINLDSDNNDADTRYFEVAKNASTFTGGTTLFIIEEGGDIGIGNSNPTTQLHIGSSSETHGLSTGDALISSDLELDGVLYLDGGTIANSAGTATILFTATPTTGTNTLSTASWLVENTSNVGQAALIVNQTKSGELFTASASGTTRFTIENDGDVTFGDASGTDLTVGGGSGKIDVGTVDPVYNIDGTKYATYMAGMIGVKEEVTGRVQTSNYVPGSGYKATIDFKEQEKGSDLWLFSRATDLKDHIEELLVLLSPSGNNNAWYRVNPDSYTLSIYTSRPTTVSYRLTAPRFDADLWTNYNDNENSIGFILEDEPLKVTNAGDIDEAEENYLAGIEMKESTKSAEGNSFFDSVTLPAFDITDKAGNVIHKIDTASKFIAANIKAGAIETNYLAVKGSAFIGENIKAGAVEAEEITSDSFLAFQGTVDNFLVKSGLVSPYIKTETISPIANSDIRVDLDNSEKKDGSSFGEFVIEGGNEEEVASIDAQGNATFSGQVESESTKTKELRAAKIYADEIVARTGAFADLKAATSSAVTREEIEELLKAVEEDQEFLAQSSNWSSSAATDSADLTEIATSDLYVTNQAAINSLSVSETIVVGNDFSIQTTKDEFGNLAATSINSLSAPLQLQSLASSPLEIMAGLVRIDTDGDVSIDGNLYVAGKIESSSLTLKEKETKDENNKFQELLALQNKAGEKVASIDASGSAYFDKLVLAGSEATTSASLLDGLVTETNATAGEGIIPEGTRDITIRSPKITDYTLVYVTPTSSTENNVLYVKEKGGGYFVVGFNKALDLDVRFNWWVIDVSKAEAKENG